MKKPEKLCYLALFKLSNYRVQIQKCLPLNTCSFSIHSMYRTQQKIKPKLKDLMSDLPFLSSNYPKRVNYSMFLEALLHTYWMGNTSYPPPLAHLVFKCMCVIHSRVWPCENRGLSYILLNMLNCWIVVAGHPSHDTSSYFTLHEMKRFCANGTRFWEYIR